MATLNNRSTTAQCAQILHVLKQGRRITAMFGVKRFGSTRVGARIWDLRDDDYPVKTEMVKTKSGKRVAEYSLPRRNWYRGSRRRMA